MVISVENIFMANEEEIYREKTGDWIFGRISLVLDTCLEFIESGQSFYLNLVNRGKTSFVTRNAATGLVAINPNCDVVFKKFKHPLRKKSKSLRIYLFLLEKICDLLRTGSTITKRDLFYQNVELFGSQSVCDGAVEDIAVSLGIRRFEFGIVASSKGLVIGPIRMRMHDSSVIDASRNVVLIPDMDQIESFVVDACNAIVVEKDASFQALVQSDFLVRYPRTILLTGKGFPDIATRALLAELSRIELNDPAHAADFTLSDGSVVIDASQQQSSLSQIDGFEHEFWDDNDAYFSKGQTSSLSLAIENSFNQDFDMNGTVPDFSSQSQARSVGVLQDSYEYLVPDEEERGIDSQAVPLTLSAKIKTFLLADCDPDGFEIMMTYKFGSAALAFYSADLAVPDLKWLGVHPSHLFSASKLALPPPVMLLPLSVRDRKKLVRMLARTHVLSSRELKRQFQALLINGYKAELQVMTIETLISFVIAPGIA